MTESWRSDVVPKFAWKLWFTDLGIAYDAKEGGIIPRSYGLAYHEWDRAVAVYMPMPLNVIVAAWRRLWWWMKVQQIPPQEMEAYRAGCRHGESFAEQRTAYLAGRLAAEEQRNALMLQQIVEAAERQGRTHMLLLCSDCPRSEQVRKHLEGGMT